MLTDNLTLVIHSCAKFSDLWDIHMKLLNENWHNRGIDTFLVTDEATDKEYPGVTILPAGDGAELSQRAEKMLPFINTEYVLVTLDDYFPIYKIDSKKIEKLVEAMDK